jgi:diketogulonate reductase-like aldo/keto reductase
MEFRELGRTGERVPEIGLGTWLYTGGESTIRRAVDLGANLIDTAESYGTEDDVGHAIIKFRNEVFLATKVSPEHFRYNDVIKAADDSLRRLRTDYIDLYQLHWPNPNIPIGETIRAVEKLVEEGKVRNIGVSNFSVAQLQEAESSLSRNRIVSNQVLYSLVNREIETDLIPYCQEHHVTIIAYSPLAQGFSNITLRDRTGVLRSITREIGRTEAQVALNWVICHNSVVAIPKTSSVSHVEENCGASGWRLSPEYMARLNSAFPD